MKKANKKNNMKRNTITDLQQCFNSAEQTEQDEFTKEFLATIFNNKNRRVIEYFYFISHFTGMAPRAVYLAHFGFFLAMLTVGVIYAEMNLPFQLAVAIMPLYALLLAHITVFKLYHPYRPESGTLTTVV
jgi:hypothetical protein